MFKVGDKIKLVTKFDTALPQPDGFEAGDIFEVKAHGDILFVSSKNLLNFVLSAGELFSSESSKFQLLTAMIEEGDEAEQIAELGFSGSQGDYNFGIGKKFIVKSHYGELVIAASNIQGTDTGYLPLWNSYRGSATEWAQAFKFTKPKKACVCPSLELFRKGCKCGHVTKRKWGLEAQ